MGNEDIRWEQRFNNFRKAFLKLDEAVQRIKSQYKPDEQGNISDDSFMDDMLKEALIQRFEYTHELAWKVMKDYSLEVGSVQAIGSKDATREAFSAGLIEEGEVWMEMIKSRNRTSHTYNEGTADEIFNMILHSFHEEFVAFLQTMERKGSGKQGGLFDA